jgi:hypothetical protein
MVPHKCIQLLCVQFLKNDPSLLSQHLGGLGGI